MKKISSNPDESVGVVIMPNPLDHRIGIYKATRLLEWAETIVQNFGDVNVYVSVHPRPTDPNHPEVVRHPTLAAAMEDGDDVLVVVAGMMEVETEEKK